jgi:hypothetical protein
LVAVAHLWRIVGQWVVIVGGWDVPTWANFVAAAAAGLLAWSGVRAIRQIQRLSS